MYLYVEFVCNYPRTHYIIMYYTLFPKYRPYIVGAANLMSSPLKKYLFTRGGVISKLQCKKDIKATRTMINVIKNNQSLVLYPVGRIPSCGEGSPTNFAVSKLVKKMKVPSILYKITQLYFPEGFISPFTLNCACKLNETSVSSKINFFIK